MTIPRLIKTVTCLNGRGPGSGAEVKLAEAHTPDLVILDIKRPEMDGFEADRAILNRTPVPIIFLTAYGEQDYVTESFMASEPLNNGYSPFSMA